MMQPQAVPPRAPFCFKGKVAVITGGASGIGLAIARAMGRAGARIVLADVQEDALAAAVAALAPDVDVCGCATDVGDADAVERLADFAFARHGATHILVNNAGVVVFGPTQEMRHDDWQWSMRVNLWGPIHGVMAFVPRMIAQGQRGHVVFTSSFAGLVPNQALGPYNVTKAAVVALAESLRKDLKGTGISASVLCPMRVESNIEQSHRNRPAALGRRPSAYAAAEEALLQGRTLASGPVAELVLAGIRDDALYIQTHREAGPLFEKRAARISASFDRAL